MEKPDSSELTALIEKYSPFFVEARRRLMFTLIVFVVATIFGFLVYEDIIKFLIEALGLSGINVVFTSPFQYINLAISCGLVSGLVFSLPLLISQILSFLKPALKAYEHKLVLRLLPFSLVLFVIGFVFGAYLMRWQIDLFLIKSVSLGIGNVLDISSILTTVLLTAALMGLGFQFPIILLLLLKIGLITPKQLAKLRRWVYLGSFLFAILLPPDSILADVLLSMPLIILFELTLILNRVKAKKE